MDEEDEIISAILIDEETDDEIDNVVDIVQSEPRNIEEQLSREDEVKETKTSNASVLVNEFIDRRKAQFKARKRTRRQYIFITAISVFAILSLVVLVLESPMYDVDKVQIKNTSATGLSAVETKQISQIVSGIEGQQTYRLDVSRQNDQLKKLLYLSSAEIEKKWPNTVDVKIYRRVPVGIIETDKGYVLVDDTGMIFEKTTSPDKALPIFEGMKQAVFTEKISNKDFLTITKSAPTELKGQIIRISLKSKSYEATLSDGIVIKLGNVTQMKEKLAIAWSIILTKSRKDIAYIDVSVPSIPVSGSAKLQL